MIDRRLSFIGICRKAGKTVFGYDKVQRELQAGKLRLVLVTADFSQKSAQKLQRICEEKNIEFVEMPNTMEEVYFSVGMKAGVIGVTDNGFAEKLKTY